MVNNAIICKRVVSFMKKLIKELLGEEFKLKEGEHIVKQADAIQSFLLDSADGELILTNLRLVFTIGGLIDIATDLNEVSRFSKTTAWFTPLLLDLILPGGWHIPFPHLAIKVSTQKGKKYKVTVKDRASWIKQVNQLLSK